MNKDDVMKLEAGYELDELIAIRVFGYTKLPPPAMPALQKPTKNGVDCLYYVNRFSTDIKAAWEVVEKLCEKWDVVDVWYERDTGFKWWCEIVGNGEGEGINADTAPLAICRAALLAVIGA